jgi:hypothetical protein
MVMALLAVAAAAPSYEVDEDYIAVRKDVLAVMDAAEQNLARCEPALQAAQDDLRALKTEADGLRAAARELQSQKALLEAHVTALETVLQREPGFAEGWERVDGPLGLAAGWGLGTAQCVGLAWVFNQDGFRSR